jgi:thioredoxin-like negative regulator of GroEL
MIRFYLSIVFFFLLANLLGQNSMQKGFTLLENGDFQEAESFFLTYLKSDPENKTALLCYGRAVGLSGEPNKATTLFAKLLKSYPNDFEIALNYNESFLWAKKYSEAKPLYAKMVADYPENFSAILGYANTLSNLKEYKKALNLVERALALEPDNLNAKVSRKYMRLGLANEFVNNQNYKNGERLLKEIFVDFPEDKDAILNLANLYLITKQVDNAKQMYKRYAVSPKDSITALNGIALAKHVGEKDREALLVVKLAKGKVAKFKDYELTEQTYDRYVQALIWNRKYVTARKVIDSLEKKHPNQNWIYALKATLGLYTGAAKQSILSYNAILKKDSSSFDGNLGKANALFAADRIIPAYHAAFKTLEFYKNQKDALGFIEKLNVLHTPSVEEHIAYTFDNGNNVAFSTNTAVSVPFSPKFSATLSYQFRTTENTVSSNKAESHVVIGGIAYKLLPKTLLKGVLGINNSRFMTEAYTQPILDLKLQTQPFKLQNLELGYQREVQNFNADLIEQEIVLNNFVLNYNLGTNFDLGWFTQVIHTQQSDDNTRNLLFTSLYYNLTRKPALKVGLNYQYITFKDQRPTIYFSPEQYQAVEVFGDLRGNFTNNTTYILNAATGFQKVEDDPTTTIFRAEAGLKHQFSKRFNGQIYGKYSNIASATAAGFEFTEIGLKVKWLFLSKPLFLDKIKQQL